MALINTIPSRAIYNVYSKNRFHLKSLQYLNTKAGNLSCALRSSARRIMFTENDAIGGKRFRIWWENWANF